MTLFTVKSLWNLVYVFSIFKRIFLCTVTYSFVALTQCNIQFFICWVRKNHYLNYSVCSQSLISLVHWNSATHMFYTHPIDFFQQIIFGQKCNPLSRWLSTTNPPFLLLESLINPIVALTQCDTKYFALK